MLRDIKNSVVDEWWSGVNDETSKTGVTKAVNPVKCWQLF